MKNHPCGVQSTESSENYRLLEVMFDVSLRCYYKNTARVRCSIEGASEMDDGCGRRG